MASTSSSTSPLLALPQELRDLIFSFAINNPLPWDREFKEWRKDDDTTATTYATPPDLSIPSHDTPTSLIFYFPAHCPIPTWYKLLFTCRAINHDVRQLVQTTTLLSSSSSSKKNPSTLPAAAEIDLSLTSTTATSTWQILPSHPSHLSTLAINIRVEDLRDRGMNSGDPRVDNKIIRALTTLLQQYCTRGPYLSRTSPLDRPLQLETVLLTLEPAIDLDGSSSSEWFFGAPDATQQIATMSGVLMIWLGRLARSGLLRGKVGKIIWDCKFVSEMGAQPWEFEVTRWPWGNDEDAREVFRRLGYEVD